MEGTARYIEYFKNYTITNDKWFYINGATYYYATGFNIARLLDKLKVDYKSRLFNKKIFLDDILREQI